MSENNNSTEEKKKKPSIILKILLFVIICACVSIGSIYFYINKIQESDAIEESRYSVPVETYNLKKTDTASFAKVGISIACNDESLVSMIEKDIDVIKDAIILTLSNKTSSDLESSQQKELLKKELITKLNEVLVKFNGDLKDKKITNIYFGTFILT